MIVPSKTFRTRISKQKKEFLDEIKALKKLPRTEENTELIKQKKQEFSTRDSTVTIEDTTVPYEEVKFKSFDGEIYTHKGSAAAKNLSIVAVYYNFPNDINYAIEWELYGVFTRLTETQANELFAYNINDIYGYNCGLRGTDFFNNDNSDTYPDVGFSNTMNGLIVQNLGIQNYKGFFDGDYGSVSIFTSPEDILKEQEIVIVNFDAEAQIVGRIRFYRNDPKLSVLGWFVIIFALLFAFGLLGKIMNLRKKN
jgi:hypothetical protein